MGLWNQAAYILQSETFVIRKYMIISFALTVAYYNIQLRLQCIGVKCLKGKILSFRSHEIFFSINQTHYACHFINFCDSIMRGYIRPGADGLIRIFTFPHLVIIYCKETAQTRKGRAMQSAIKYNHLIIFSTQNFLCY
jgi:hypothetical protein